MIEPNTIYFVGSGPGDPELITLKAKKLLEKEAEYAEKFATPYLAAERGFIDEVIEPRETRKKLIKAFAILENKVAKRSRKKHGNIPL